MRISQNYLPVTGLLLLAITACGTFQDSRRVELFRHPGLQWLSWTPQERENFVYGYINGYGEGMDLACLAADKLFETNEPHNFGHGDVTSTFPSTRCRESVALYPSVKIDLSKGPDFSAYTNVITGFYRKHPEYRDTPITVLMESLAGTKRLTADDIYRKWTTHESPPSR